MSEFHIRAIPIDLIERFWPFAEPYIKRALDHSNGEVPPSYIKQLCLEGAAQLWLISENNRVIAAVTADVVTYPTRKHARIITIAGSRAPEWTGDVVTILEDWARSQNCDSIETYCRKGYVPTFSTYGYKYKYAIVVKDLT